MNQTTTKTKRDTRIVFNRHRIEHEGTSWIIDGKADPKTGTLKIYRVEGDVTKPERLKEALQALADSVGLKLALETR
jgi:hypothetical protein